MLTKTVAKPATKSMTKTATRNSNKNSNKSSDKDSDKDIDKDSDDTYVSNRESAASGRDRGTLFDYLGWCYTEHIWRRIERLATVLTWGSQEYIRQIPFYTYSTNTDLLSCHSRVLFVSLFGVSWQLALKRRQEKRFLYSEWGLLHAVTHAIQ